jgi:hypothetical protein
MKTTTPLFPNWHLPSLRRKPRSSQQIIACELQILKQKTFTQLGECFQKFIPKHLLDQNEKGAHSRRRFFSKNNTFWAFFSQVIDADGGCREVVAKIQAYATLKLLDLPSGSTAAYCNARKKLCEKNIAEIYTHTTSINHDLGIDLVEGRRVIVVDGTGVSMPDTKSNQKVWPQQKQQKRGCGFPTAHICGCFNLASGVLLSYKTGNKKSSELTLLRKQNKTFKPGDIMLGDKMFCNYYDIATRTTSEVDSVVTLPARKRKPIAKSKAFKALGKDDLLIKWIKPHWDKNLAYTRKQWEKLPKELILRQIKVNANVPGFRTKQFYIITTLLDADIYPASNLAELYFKRWDVELFFRDIKTTMGMDVLRCKSPGMIRKEILMNFIVYNCIRHLIYESAQHQEQDVDRISFKGAVQSIRQWEPCLEQAQNNARKRNEIIAALHKSIAQNKVPERPWRSEPRCKKRRPKPYQLLTSPRKQMKETPHRGRKHAKAA